MIDTRNGHLVIGRHAVPVREITNAICDRVDMDWLTNRYPLQKSDVMACIDCIADLDNLNGKGDLTLRNSAINIGEVTVETKTISDIFFLKAIQYGAIFLPKEYDFNTLYDKGFRMLAIESFEDVLNGSVTFKSSDLHNIVYNAIMEITDGEFNKEDFVNFLKQQDG